MRSFLDNRVTLWEGDCLKVLPGFDAESIDSVVTDPPYHLTSIVERFGAEDAAPAKSNGATGIYARASAGFMGKEWDGGDVAFNPETWKAVSRVLKPGGYLVAFGAPKNIDLLTGAIRAAGFEIRDRIVNFIAADEHVARLLGSLSPEQVEAFMLCLDDSAFGPELQWVFGTGFPKSHSPGDKIDRHLFDDDEWDRGERSHRAAFWGQFGTALKPAYEPIVFARKPLIGTVAENVLKHGTGAINVDGCRISAADGVYAGNAAGDRGHADNRKRDMGFALGAGRAHDLGRWPANVCHDGSDDVLAEFPLTASGTGAVKKASSAGYRAIAYGAESRPVGTPNVEYGDKGSAARFFYTTKADANDRVASRHPTVKPIDLMRWLCRLVTPPGGTILDPFAGTGTTAEAAFYEGFNSVLIEREPEYIGDIERRMSLVLAGPQERAVETAKARSRGKRADDGPLFAGPIT